MREEQFEAMHQEARGQTQEQQPGVEYAMKPEPIYDDPDYVGSGKLTGKVALITGGDSGIGRAVAVAYAKEGANVAIVYLNEGKDAEKTKSLIEGYGVKALKIAKDVSQPENAQEIIDTVIEEFGQLNIVVNNAGKQFPQDDFLAITPEQLKETFETNVFSMFYLIQAALPHLHKEDAIINTSSVTAYRGAPTLIDYSDERGNHDIDTLTCLELDREGNPR